MKILIVFLLIIALTTRTIIGMDKNNIFEQYKESLRILSISFSESRFEFNELAEQLKDNHYGSLQPFERKRKEMLCKGDTVYEKYWNLLSPESVQFVCHPATNRFLQILEANTSEQKQREEENERLAQQVKTLNLYLYPHLAAIHQSLITVQRCIAHSSLQIAGHPKIVEAIQTPSKKSPE